MGASFDFFATAAELARRGEPFATATVVRVERPTSGKPGDRAIVTGDGRLRGWVGGSCARPTVVDEALAALADGESRLVRLASAPEDDGAREGVTDRSMTCFSGGTMEIFIEPNLPRPRLMVVGREPLARALVALAKAMGYEVVAVGGELAGTDGTLASSAEIPDRVHARTAIVVATHGEGDEIALEHALASRAPYVGLVASRKRAGSIREYLAARGIDRERLAALKAPAGLDLGARAPEEIALSILAELVQHWRRSAAISSPRAAEEPAAEAATAVDPVCGMSVATAGADHVHAHAGATYYFCCAGCRTRFAAAPESFLAGG